MDTPGNDPVSDGLVAGGCNLGVFTTGRGGVFCANLLHVSAYSHSLYEWMEDDMDLNAGTIIDGRETVQEVGKRLFDQILRVASGESTKSESQGMGDEEFAPWMLKPDTLSRDASAQNKGHPSIHKRWPPLESRSLAKTGLSDALY